MTEAPEPVDFRAELLARKQAALDAMQAKKSKAAREGAAAAEGRLTPEDLARELEEAPIVAGPGGDVPPGAAPDPARKKGEPPKEPPRKASRPRGEIWDGCPVKPLGTNSGVFYYLDRHGQLRAITKHENGTIIGLFGDRNQLLCQHFPTYAKGATEPSKNRFDSQRATMVMIAACSERGLFDPRGTVRGTGAWADDDGGLIYHCGDRLLTPEGEREPGAYGECIYPAQPSVPAPAAAVGRVDPGPIILQMASTWRYEHQDAMPMIVLGLAGLQMMGGALDWRPVTWITGDRAYGKSSLQDMLKYLQGGDKGVIKSADATKSGITSQIGHSSRPVAIDELEPGEDGSRREQDIVTLARIAASGDQWLRGSADQTGASGNVYSAFLFSSILIPGGLTPADRSRLITINLRPLPEDAVEPHMDPRTWRGYGATLKRLLIDRWPSWRKRMEIWHTAMAKIGVGGRPGKNWATMLAMADMALHKDLPSDDYVAGWVRKVSAAAVHETEGIGSDADAMLMHLMGQHIDPFRRGETYTIAQWVQTAAKLPAAPDGLVISGEASGTGIDDIERERAADRANKVLAKFGLRVNRRPMVPELFLPNSKLPGTMQLFAKSTWANGVWAQSAARIVGAKPSGSLTLAGLPSRGVYVPMDRIAGLMAFPMDGARTQTDRPTSQAMPEDWEDAF